jgi:ABC-type glucose/galactose transport system permease subunit
MRQKLADFFNAFLDLQKALIMLLLIIIGVTFRVLNLISGSDMVDLLKNTVIAFFAVHATQHIVSTVNSYYNNKNAPDDPPDDPSDPSTPPPPPGVKL